MSTTTQPHPHTPHLTHLLSASTLLAPLSPLLASHTTSRILSLISSRTTASTSNREVTLAPSTLRQFCKRCQYPLVPGWNCQVRTAGSQSRYGEIGKGVRKRMREEARKKIKKAERKEVARIEAGGRVQEGVKKEGEAERLRRKQREREKGIVVECAQCGFVERIVLDKPKAVRRKQGGKKVVATATTTTTTTTTSTTTAAVGKTVVGSKVQTTQIQTQTTQASTTIGAAQTAKARAKKRKQGLLSEVLAKKKKEDEAKARGGGLGGGLGGLDLMDLMRTG